MSLQTAARQEGSGSGSSDSPRWARDAEPTVGGGKPSVPYSVLRGVSEARVAAVLRLPMGELLRTTRPRRRNKAV